ncbi:MAG: class I SAM-dependent methyltransferase [Oscillospiraceae bacterium]|jgi:23S rRNA (cytosine1962-C5)-methyltransferase|nr:class I SAM-dependent methyltransferase [Oscillospiraceae bacterium]
MRIKNEWRDIEVLDATDGEKLERWGPYTLIRPDPQVIWKTPRGPEWKKAHARYIRSDTGGGRWDDANLPAREWTVSYKDLSFRIRPTNFKHTGLFPEQAVNWDYMRDVISAAGRPVRVLNLFAYTGGATLACAAAGAEVCHVDASKGIVTWARENAALSGLEQKPIRWIVDDCKKYVEREARRGKTYDGIIMDPPSYGRGPGGEVWKLEDAVFDLVRASAALLSDNALFFMLNSYTTGLSPSVMAYILAVLIKAPRGGAVTSSEIGLAVKATGQALPCGSTAIWQSF